MWAEKVFIADHTSQIPFFTFMNLCVLCVFAVHNCFLDIYHGSCIMVHSDS